ncbi:MAG: AraC family transcriptional regulator [Pseudomonadales bacterium]|nr:AraC family transcriptional regulator [Pseudomonadales bacterium]
MQHAYSVSRQFTEEVISAYQRLDLNLQKAQQNLEFDQDYFLGHEERVPLTRFCELIKLMEENAKIEELGLLLGTQMEPAGFTILGHLVMACNTIGEALALVSKLQPLVIDCADSSCEEHQHYVEFSWSPNIELPCNHRVIIDLIISATRQFGIWATGITDSFYHVSFQYPKPQNTDIYQKIFGHAGSFNQPTNSFSIPSTWYNRPIKSANKELKPIIYHRAEELLKQIQTKDDIVLRLRHALEHLLPEGHATIESAAAVLYVSPRTLQRYLHERATSFSEVLQQVRFSKAEQLLKTTQLPLIEIAARVGYREQSSFSYAYKNWSGISPKKFRMGNAC